MKKELDLKDLATIFKALGEPSRLKIFQYLCSCCSSFSVDEEANISFFKGVSVSDVCCKVTGENNITSTLSHHLKELRNAGIITMERKGKNILCSINKDLAFQVLQYFEKMTGQCCGGKKQ